ncbi:MAG TPA: hypothetical protein VNQ99_04780 [Xanthobacteraceae bacterium]|nr:hypothetical protein [Xanthobacteraceae bacterium]
MNTIEADFETLAAWIREKPEHLERVWAFLDAPTLEDIRADATLLHRLLDALADHIMDRGHLVIDGKRNQAMETIAALAIIARDHTSKIEDDFDAIFDHGVM